MTEGVNAEPLETKVARHLPVIEVVQSNPRFGTIATRRRSTQSGESRWESGHVLAIAAPAESSSEILL